MPRLAVLLALIVTQVCAAAPPTVAVINDRSSEPSGKAALELIEASLLQSPDFRFVERNRIDAVISEQRLQSLLSPGDADARALLGRTLGAKCLVVLRARPAGKSVRVEAIFCETTFGLRLGRHLLPANTDDRAEIAALRLSLSAAVKRADEPIKTIVAVPPFADNNLGRGHGWMKSDRVELKTLTRIAA